MAKRKIPFWAKIYSADIGNGDENITDPGTTKQENGWIVEKPLLQHMNWVLNLFGKYLTSISLIKSIGGGVELEAGDRVKVDNSTATRTVSLPADPEDGQWVEIGTKSDVSIYGVTVNGGSKDIMIIGDKTCELDMDGVIFKFYWDNTNAMWLIDLSGEVGIDE